MVSPKTTGWKFSIKFGIHSFLFVKRYWLKTTWVGFYGLNNLNTKKAKSYLLMLLLVFQPCFFLSPSYGLSCQHFLRQLLFTIKLRFFWYFSPKNGTVQMAKLWQEVTFLSFCAKQSVWFLHQGQNSWFSI